MKKIGFAIVFLVFLCCTKVGAQCDVKNRVLADGSMVYYFEPATFYTTNTKSLKINIVTDKENYFIALQPTPFPEKSEGKKIKDDLVLQLSNSNWYTLKHFDTQYLKQDSIFQVLYLIDKKDLEFFRTNEAIVAKINMKGTEFVRDYYFKLHKKAIMKQLECLLKEEDK